MSDRADVVVVGGGVMGLAAARALARAGRDVAVFEQDAIGGTHGSSHGSARIFRLAYPDPAYVRMGIEARALWDALSGEAGEELIRPTPALSIGRGLDELQVSMRDGGADIETIAVSEAQERFPVLRLMDVQSVIVEHGAGVIMAARALDAFRRSAEARGARIHERTPVSAVRPVGEGVEVVAGDRTVRADAAVVTAGAWARGLLDGAGVALPTWCTVETVGFFEGPAAETPILLEWGEPQITYLLPTPEGTLKAAEHLSGPKHVPGTHATPDPASLGRVGAWLVGRIEGTIGDPVASETCLYTMTDDESFILERHGPIVVGSACSGHGFKFAPLVGEHLARLALET